ncbi:unnamed protein product, partial [Meganyctiphanes norvegica]
FRKMDINSPIYDKLPKKVVERSSNLIGLPKPHAEEGSAKQQLRTFLETHVPENDKKEVTPEIRKGFLLSERKKICNPHKSLKKDCSSGAPNRGKKRMTGREIRELGLHKLDKNNKTFEMFIPVNDMWKEYARDMLGIKHLANVSWKGTGTDGTTTAVQGRLRKLEYFGCFVRITRSRCSDYIGLNGIIIKETKYIFMLICPDDKIKTIPKMNSEFSFMVESYGFSILGNHLMQRPIERAKADIKKLCMGL